MSISIAYGFWITPQGKIIHIDDHFRYVLDNYKKFRMPKSIADERDRDKIMRWALEMGWVRVAGDSASNFSFEVWRLNNNNLADIKSFLTGFHVDPGKKVMLEQASKPGKSFYVPASDIYNDELLAYTNPYKILKRKDREVGVKCRKNKRS